MEINNNIFLPTNIKYLRNRNGITQQNLADILGKTNTAISNWEKGIREPDAVDMAKISNYFNIPIDTLMLKDLRFKNNSSNSFDELEVLFDKHKDILTNDDKDYIKFIIEKRKKEIDEQNGNI